MDFNNEGFKEKLLSAFQKGDDTVGEIIEQHLSEKNINSLIEWFEKCSHGDSDEIVPLLKMLVSFSRTRGRATSRAIQLIQKNVIVGKIIGGNF